jgi:propionate CoA-transferase
MATFLPVEDAVGLIKDGDTLLVEGFCSCTCPYYLENSLETRFLKEGRPRKITLLHCSAHGDGKDTLVNRLAHEGMIKRSIGGHWNLVPKMGKLAMENKIEAYNLPQGVLAHMMRDIAAGRKTISKVGLKSFVDPRLEGGKLNSVTTEELVQLINVDGEELLYYKQPKIDVCFLRGTTADEKGNISYEDEGLRLGALACAQATRKSGGIVIVQVLRIAKAGTLKPAEVVIPHILVDVVVRSPSLAEHMWEHSELSPAFAGQIKVPLASVPPLKFNERKIICRRAAMMLEPGTVVNLGIGMAEGVSAVANEEEIGDWFTLTVEAGPVGGVPMGGVHFGVAVNPDAILDHNSQFDFYDGGGLDIAFLGLAEVDQNGNLNVSKLAGRIPGCGGFINIAQNTPKVVFLGTFTAVGMKIKSGDGKLVIEQEGQQKKFLQKVAQITFSGEYARETGQSVTYITERAVFELRENGVHLVEAAPGIDIKKDILAQMDFVPKMDTPPKLMDARIFMDKPMGLSRK